jgi:hypothetical protein
MRMKARFLTRFPVLVFSLITVHFSPGFAQGPLTPPGGPSPSMKSLDQIEARTAISSAPFSITSSGSYYLTQNLTVASGNAITITASNVTLDLNGFAISSTESPAGSSSAILISSGLANITIMNGLISSNVTYSGSYSGTGFGNGIAYTSGTAPSTARVHGVSVYHCLAHGIYLGFNSSVVQGCVVNTVGGYGIYADSVANSTALNCGSGGVLANNAMNSTGSANNSGNGVQATTATNCYGLTTGNGIGLNANAATNCYGYNSATGIGLNAIVASGSYGYSVSGAGLMSNIATGSYGYCAGPASFSHGLHADSSAISCFGFSAGNGTALYSAGTVENSYGQCAGSGTGLYSASGVMNCYGASAGGYGIYVGDNGTASYSTGLSTAPSSPVAINCNAGVAIGCSTQGGTIVAAQKFLGTP